MNGEWHHAVDPFNAIILKIFLFINNIPILRFPYANELSFFTSHFTPSKNILTFCILVSTGLIPVPAGTCWFSHCQKLWSQLRLKCKDVTVLWLVVSCLWLHKVLGHWTPVHAGLHISPADISKQQWAVLFFHGSQDSSWFYFRGILTLELV